MSNLHPHEVQGKETLVMPESMFRLISNTTVMEPGKETSIKLVFITTVNHNNRCTPSSLMSSLVMGGADCNNNQQLAEALKAAFMVIPPGHIVTVKLKCRTGIIAKLKVKKDKKAIPQ